VAEEVRRAVLDYASTHAEIDARREAATLANERVRIAGTAFRTGDATATDVAQAALAASDARTALFEAIARELDAAVTLEHATGGALE
jgi:outer membrane protein TolC